MKIKTIFLFGIILLFTSTNVAQVKVDQIAPNITISDYIINSENNKDLKNKYIVLEFWATWCKPCLEQVPHINNLQTKFKDNKNLKFISITNEKPEKIARTLNRVQFKTMVVCDQSGKTFSDFISDKDGNYSIPKTILIDNKGIIKWIGLPNNLSEDIINNFISDENLNEVQVKGSVVASPETLAPVQERVIDVAYKLTYNEENKYSFILLNGNSTEFKMHENTLKTHGVFFELNKNLPSLLADLSNTFESHISLPPDLANQNYSLFYKNSLFLDEEKKVLDIKFNLLKTLNLVETVTTKKTAIYNLKVVDKTKLENITNSPEKLKSDTNTNFILFDSNISEIGSRISKYYDVIIKNKITLDGIYDLILSNISIEATIKDLNYYGLTLEKSEAESQFFEYNKQ